MTADERDTIRAAVDAARRKRVAIEDRRHGVCVGCGMRHSDFTPGCKSCRNRWRNYRTGRTRNPFPDDPIFLSVTIPRLIAAHAFGVASLKGEIVMARLGRKYGGKNWTTWNRGRDLRARA